MATIDDLNKSILEFSEQEVFDLIKERRFSRRVEKATNKKAKKQAAAKKPKRTLDLSSALAALSDDQKQSLLKDLIGG